MGILEDGSLIALHILQQKWRLGSTYFFFQIPPCSFVPSSANILTYCFVNKLYQAPIQLFLGHLSYCSSPTWIVLSKFTPAVFWMIVNTVIFCYFYLLYCVEMSLLCFQAQNWSCSFILKTREAADIHRSISMTYWWHKKAMPGDWFSYFSGL